MLLSLLLLVSKNYCSILHCEDENDQSNYLILEHHCLESSCCYLEYGEDNKPSQCRQKSECSSLPITSSSLAITVGVVGGLLYVFATIILCWSCNSAKNTFDETTGRLYFSNHRSTICCVYSVFFYILGGASLFSLVFCVLFIPFYNIQYEYKFNVQLLLVLFLVFGFFAVVGVLISGFCCPITVWDINSSTETDVCVLHTNRCLCLCCITPFCCGEHQVAAAGEGRDEDECIRSARTFHFRDVVQVKVQHNMRLDLKDGGTVESTSEVSETFLRKVWQLHQQMILKQAESGAAGAELAFETNSKVSTESTAALVTAKGNDESMVPVNSGGVPE